MSAETCSGIRLLAEDFSLALVVVVAAAFNGSQSRRPRCGVIAAAIKSEMLLCFGFSELLVSVSNVTKYFAFTKHFFLSEGCKQAAWMKKQSFSISKDHKPNCWKNQHSLCFGAPVTTLCILPIYMCRCSCRKMGSLRQAAFILLSGCKQRNDHA